MYFVIMTCKGLLYGMLVLLLLRQILPFFSKYPTKAERTVGKITEPLFFAADCFCRMAGVSPGERGIDHRYPVASLLVMLAVCAVGATEEWKL